MSRENLFPRIHKVLEEAERYRKGEREAANLQEELDAILGETIQAAGDLREDAAKQEDGESEHDQRVSSVAHLYENAASRLHKDLLDLFKIPKLDAPRPAGIIKV
ncbi:hypothetical protein NBV64_05905 [Alcaligenes sp. DN25]|uniref:hypothetical protein n=1 Tax=Alcaligenes TaxID=507 RepID=UPI00202DC3B0|nr:MULTISPECIES: hypothetical protein [Alcaligenes]URW83886.1 hypothetical protein NBV64_05905 [Alcaligenes sp. DN25]WEA68724.1 hypothetical protein PWH35_05915 [Alcaligenes faecalis]